MLDAQDREQLDHYHDLSVGEIMRRARIAKGLGLTGIAEALNIRVEHISAIENNDVAALPPRVYALGFVRAYADFLGLEGEKLVYLFKSQMVGRRAQGRLMPGALQTPPFVWDFRYAGIAAVMIVTLGSAMIWGWQASEEGPAPLLAASDTVPDVPEDMQTALSEVDEEPPVLAVNDAVVELVSPDVLGALAPAAGSKSYGVRAQDAGFAIMAREVAWLEVKHAAPNEDGDVTILLTRVLQPGDVFYAPKDEKLEVNTGNALGLQIATGGDTKDFPKAQDIVVRGIFLENGELVQ